MQAVVKIERFADQGRCIAHHEGRVLFVRFALPGETVRVSIDLPAKPRASFWNAEVVEVLDPSPHRVAPPWGLAGPLAMGGGAGGADLIHVDRVGQLEWKSAMIAEQCNRIGKLGDVHVSIATADGVSLEELRGNPDLEPYGGLHWRTRLEMMINHRGRTAMRRRHSHEHVPIETMPLATKALLAVADRHDLWHAMPPNSRVRIAVPEPRLLRDGSDLAVHVPANQLNTSFVASDDVAALRGDDAAALLHAVGNNYAIVVDGACMYGSQVLVEQITIDASHCITYGVAATGFWQMHRSAPQTLAQYVLDKVRQALESDRTSRGSACPSTPVIWELYSGSGLFTLPIAMYTGRLVHMLCVEGDETAVRHARRNVAAIGNGDVAGRQDGAGVEDTDHARSTGLLSGLDDRIEERCGDVETVLSTVTQDATLRRFAHPSVVVMDPPRAGVNAGVCNQVAQSGAPTVVYVSCNPASLARDLGALTQLGYELESLQAFDIYPMTHHVETVLVLTKKR